MVGKLHHRHRADGVIAPHHLEERLLPEALTVQSYLKRLIPSPALHDVRSHRRAFGFERIAQRRFVLRQQMKLDVGWQIGKMHVWLNTLTPPSNRPALRSLPPVPA